MEDTLRVLRVLCDTTLEYVLILVLMEDTLRVNSIYGDYGKTMVS